MKNNSKVLIYLLICFISFGQNKIYANDIIFNTSEINIIDNGNTTKAGSGSAYSKVDNIRIDGQNFKFDNAPPQLRNLRGVKRDARGRVELGVPLRLALDPEARRQRARGV